MGNKCNSAWEATKNGATKARDNVQTRDYAGAWENVKNTTKKTYGYVKDKTNQALNKVRGKSPTTSAGTQADGQPTAASRMSSAAADVLKRRRLQNRPKSHVVVLERLLEEIQ